MISDPRLRINFGLDYHGGNRLPAETVATLGDSCRDQHNSAWLDRRRNLPPRVTADHEMELTTGINFDWNELGSGIYPYSSKPIWPSPIVACINAFTAAPVGASGYFEQTIS